MKFEQIKIGEVIKHRKGFFTIDDSKEYKLCRVQLHRRGVVLREILKGSAIRTKKQQVCKAGDFLVAEMDAKVGGYGFVPKELDGAIVSSHYFLFELDERRIRPRYLDVISQLQILQDQIKAVGSTNYAAIRPANVLNWDIPITNIKKQKEIEILFDSTRAIGNELSNEFLNQQDLLTQLRQSYLREAMQGKMVKQDPKDGHAKVLLEKIKAEKAKSGRKEKELPPIMPEEIPFEIPKNWVWSRLGEICNYGSSAKAEAKDIKSDTWVLDLEDIEKETSRLLCKIRYSERKSLSTKSVFKKGDVLYSKLRPYLDKVIVADEEGVCTTEMLPLRLYGGLNPYLVRYALKRTDFLSYVNSVTKGMKMPRLGTKEGQMALIPLPPLPEQKRIVEKLDKLLRLCTDLQESIQTSREQNDLLLQQVLKEALNI